MIFHMTLRGPCKALIPGFGRNCGGVRLLPVYNQFYMEIKRQVGEVQSWNYPY